LKNCRDDFTLPHFEEITKNRGIIMKNEIDVAIVMGSDSDLPIMKDAAKFLDQMGISYEVKVLSVHRTPEKAFEYANSLK